MTRTLVFLALAIASTAAVAAPHFKPGSVACTSEHAFRDAVSASAINDNEALAKLVDSEQCATTDEMYPLKISVIQKGATMHVRAYLRGQSMDFWTFPSAIGY